jgi:hypothetical protein
MYLWLCCEGWVRFGAYDDLRFDATHNIVAGEMDLIAVFRPWGSGLRWETPNGHQGFRWETPVFTTSSIGPYVDRVYIVHTAKGFSKQRRRIGETCERLLTIADDGSDRARRDVVRLARNEADAGTSSLRL